MSNNYENHAWVFREAEKILAKRKYPLWESCCNAIGIVCENLFLTSGAIITMRDIEGSRRPIVEHWFDQKEFEGKTWKEKTERMTTARIIWLETCALVCEGYIEI